MSDKKICAKCKHYRKEVKTEKERYGFLWRKQRDITVVEKNCYGILDEITGEPIPGPCKNARNGYLWYLNGETQYSKGPCGEEGKFFESIN